MKVYYSRLNCPHCGSGEFRLIKDDIFECEYCKQRFNVDIDNLEFGNENKILIDELKNEFRCKKDELYDELIRNRKMIKKYSELANKQSLLVISVIGMIICLILLCYSHVIAGLICLTISAGVMILSKTLQTKRGKKYQKIANEYAKKAVRIDTEINYYNALLGKLTK